MDFRREGEGGKRSEGKEVNDDEQRDCCVQCRGVFARRIRPSTSSGQTEAEIDAAAAGWATKSPPRPSSSPSSVIND